MAPRKQQAPIGKEKIKQNKLKTPNPNNKKTQQLSNTMLWKVRAKPGHLTGSLESKFREQSIIKKK